MSLIVTQLNQTDEGGYEMESMNVNNKSFRILKHLSIRMPEMYDVDVLK